MPSVSKIRSLHIFEISPEKLGAKLIFLPADKHKKSFVHGNSITLGVWS